jgi:hypothetical protein
VRFEYCYVSLPKKNIRSCFCRAASVATAVLMVEKRTTRGDFFSPTFSDINAHIQYYICTHIVDRLLKRLRSTRARERQGGCR